MQLNVAQKVKHYKLAKTKAYLAVFEAVSNAIDSYKDSSRTKEITIELYRDNSGLDFGNDDTGKEIKLYKEIRIIDSGIGFNNENFESFNISDSDYKQNIGGKGLGRFSWLKAFESVKIESVYLDDGIYYSRKFNFEKTITGVSDDILSEASNKKTGTTIRLINQKKEWDIPKKATTLCEKLIEHFLPYFLSVDKPVFIIKDMDDSSIINVNEYFVDNYRGEIGNTVLMIKEREFKISVHKTKIGSCNQLI
jgi:anti-sigma regulatory factor (Ser/Thr protein kinase)